MTLSIKHGAITSAYFNLRRSVMAHQNLGDSRIDPCIARLCVQVCNNTVEKLFLPPPPPPPPPPHPCVLQCNSV